MHIRTDLKLVLRGIGVNRMVGWAMAYDVCVSMGLCEFANGHSGMSISYSSAHYHNVSSAININDLFNGDIFESMPKSSLKLNKSVVRYVYDIDGNDVNVDLSNHNNNYISVDYKTHSIICLKPDLFEIRFYNMDFADRFDELMDYTNSVIGKSSKVNLRNPVFKSNEGQYFFKQYDGAHNLPTAIDDALSHNDINQYVCDAEFKLSIINLHDITKHDEFIKSFII